jgi:hypothetical protein
MMAKEMQSQAVQGAARAPSSAGDKVTVLCKLPHGLRIRNFKMVDRTEQGIGGISKDVKIAEVVGEHILINGNACEIDKRPRCVILEGGYAVTTGVDRDSWEAWLRDNRDAAYVRNGLVKAVDSMDAAEGFDADNEAARSGLEPFMIDGDPRAPRSSNPNLSSVAREDDQAKRRRAA